MADFKTHVSFSSAAGAAYGTGIWLLGVPGPTSAVAGGICAIAGMFPDIDSKTSRALQETLYLLAGLVCMLVLLRLRNSNLNGDLILAIGAATFVLTKFVVGRVVANSTVHRGIIHSIPAALIAGELAFLLSTGPDAFRFLKAAALVIGFLSHLVLDEIYSVDVRGIRLKKSFGTALKFTCLKKPKKTVFIYLLLFGLGYLIAYEETWSGRFADRTGHLTTEGIRVLEKYSNAAYSESDLWVSEWEQYQWFMTFFPSGTKTSNHDEEEEGFFDEEETPDFVKPAFSREPFSRNAYSTPTKPYQPSEQSQKLIDWGNSGGAAVPNSSSTVPARNSVFKSMPPSPIGRL